MDGYRKKWVERKIEWKVCTFMWAFAFSWHCLNSGCKWVCKFQNNLISMCVALFYITCKENWDKHSPNNKQCRKVMYHVPFLSLATRALRGAQGLPTVHVIVNSSIWVLSRKQRFNYLHLGVVIEICYVALTRQIQGCWARLRSPSVLSLFPFTWLFWYFVCSRQSLLCSTW
jgi:hypothetical protein